MDTVLLVEVQLDGPGSEDLARHLKQPAEGAVLELIVDLSDRERRGLRVTSRILDADGVEL